MYIDKAIRRIHDAIAKGLMDKKLLIKGGWALYRAQVMPVDASEIQVRETEQAFYAGAQHLFACIMSGLDEGVEPTDNDMQRMDNIHAELAQFADKLAAKYASSRPTKGNA